MRINRSKSPNIAGSHYPPSDSSAVSLLPTYPSQQGSSVQLLSLVLLFVTPRTAQHTRPPCPSPTPRVYSNSCPLSQWCHPTISSSVPSHPLLLLPSIFPSIQVFSNESALCIRWPKYWNFSFNISPSNEYSGLISFRMDWLDLLAVQGTLKSLLQHCSSKASILRCSAFFIVQLPSIQDYWKNHSLDWMDHCWQSSRAVVTF